MDSETRNVFKQWNQNDTIPQEREMIVCAELLLDHEKELVGKTMFFGVEGKDNKVYFVKPSDRIPASFKLIRSSPDSPSGGNRPIRLPAVGGG